MDAFDELLEVAKILQGPKGCPWDREQTFESLKPYILEESHELLEAVDGGNEEEIIEELGDLFYTVIFYAKVAEKEKRFSLKEVIERIKAKLIRRHPHVFGEKKADSIQEVIENWESIKKEEKEERKSLLDGIPKTLPSLHRAQKILTKIKKHPYPKEGSTSSNKEEELAKQILEIIHIAIEEEIDIESVFRKALNKEESSFKAWELKSTQN